MIRVTVERVAVDGSAHVLHQIVLQARPVEEGVTPVDVRLAAPGLRFGALDPATLRRDTKTLALLLTDRVGGHALHLLRDALGAIAPRLRGR